MSGSLLGSNVPVEVFDAAKTYRSQQKTGSLLMTVAVLGLALAVGGWAFTRIRPELRAQKQQRDLC